MTAPDQILVANLIDIHRRDMYACALTIRNGFVESVQRTGQVRDDLQYILPGFVDAHIHIESSMVTPPAFARMAVRHGTVATVSDPHEIANVCGVEGVRYMADLGRASGFPFCFGAPSCVPATSFETAGAEITASDIRTLLEEGSCRYLSEMMNYPAVLGLDPLVMEKIAVARERGVPVDGHAPGLRGEEAHRYAGAGITTDHECTVLAEALDKITAGMHILIREGSAARNYEALHKLIRLHPERVMFCSDDKHPDDLVRGHINELVLRSLRLGYDLYDVLRIASLHPVEHYRLEVGLLRPGDPADFILIDHPRDFQVRSTYLRGHRVYDGHQVSMPEVPIPVINQFDARPVHTEDLALTLRPGEVRVILANDGSLLTDMENIVVEGGPFESLPESDILKLAVVNRYQSAPPALALIRGVGLRRGAIASSVAHDSHNIVAVGVSDEDLKAAINAVIEAGGGIAAAIDGRVRVLALPVAGLMSTGSVEETAAAYEEIDQFVKQRLGSALRAPFMTLSFMALLVIPSLKLSDLGLFDGNSFRFVPLQDV